MTSLTDLTSAYADVRKRQRITGMTPAQAEALTFIETYINAHGHSPNYREIAEGIGRKSTGNVAYLIEALIRRGHLVRTEGRARSIELAHKTCPNCGHPQ